ncbi:hypothetical protein GUITHDRAFT_153553 [Guillardia theta CCMP2712]|uniref:Uncharacterized protein n=2 Tax=Guillardia theta TaxID=55529 RepID=L1J359_GUITC|nr:hypothetical protein GUITHDRAFT_153553 [Guillardia theta CCMP2712]EKX42530.1 hypothetical protein GUITHDRAFT_153553 [Guillardia theta CCMP2712]|eukprot:XP_005829510.1 hypothetical protein GUITHDRAFT_153553 [Guillardia theta CCMP2712]
MWAALLAVLHIMIINEMSDKLEVQYMVAICSMKLSKDVPGIFLVLGAAFLNVPIFTYGIFNEWFGLRFILTNSSVIGQFTSGFCYFALICVGLLLLWGYYNRVPHFVGVVYQAKVAAYQQDVAQMSKSKRQNRQTSQSEVMKETEMFRASEMRPSSGRSSEKVFAA